MQDDTCKVFRTKFIWLYARVMGEGKGGKGEGGRGKRAKELMDLCVR